MSNPMKYIKDLEAAGFDRNQAEAQVQMVLDAVEGELVTKSDFAVFRQDLEHRFERIDAKFVEHELRLVIKLGLITVGSITALGTVMAWLIKVH